MALFDKFNREILYLSLKGHGEVIKLYKGKNLIYRRKFFIVGVCNKTENNTAWIPSDNREVFEGEVGQIYVKHAKFLYPRNKHYNNKRLVVLAGPFFSEREAEEYKESYYGSLERTLEQRCENRSTIDIFWNSDAGCDFDIQFIIEGIGYGWHMGEPEDGDWGMNANAEWTEYGEWGGIATKYAKWYGDNTSCSGAEQVSLNKEVFLSENKKLVPILLKGHWYNGRSSGIITIIITSGNSSKRFQYRVEASESSAANYETIGTVTINLETDEITLPQSNIINSSSESQLPEDLQ